MWFEFMTETAYGSQHTLPRTYLNAWRDPGTPNSAYVWVFSRDGTGGHYSAPKKLFAEEDFYTKIDEHGARDLSLEHALREVEDRFAKLRDALLVPEEPVTLEEGAYIVEFMLAMSFRTAAHRERRRNEWRNALTTMLEAQKRAGTDEHGRPPTVRYSFSPDPKHPSLSVQDVQRLIDTPIQHAFSIEMATYLPIMTGMNMLVLRTNDEPGFITSDDPCVWINKEINQGPPALAALGDFGILMPLSPCQIMFLNPFTSGYSKAGPNMVDEFNRITREHAHQEIVVSRNQTRGVWFDASADS